MTDCGGKILIKLPQRWVEYTKNGAECQGEEGAKGVPTKWVKELTGHFSLAVTDRYTHALPKDAIDEDVLDFEKMP